MNKRCYASLLIVCLLWIPIGCKASGPEREKLLVGPRTATELGYRIDWPLDLGLRGDKSIIHAKVLGDRIVFVESGNIISVWDSRTGKPRWRTRVGSDLERFHSPSRSGDSLVLCSETQCYVYDITIGGLLNVFALKAVASNTPLVVDGMIVYGSPTGMAYAQGINDGLEYGRLKLGTASAATPIPVGQNVAIASVGGYVFLSPTRLGSTNWRGNVWGEITAGITASPDTVYVASEDRSLYAFRSTTSRPTREAQLRWRYYTEQPLKTGPTLLGDTVYQYVPKSGLVALDAVTGDRRWTMPWADGTPILLRGDRLYVHRKSTKTIAIVLAHDGLVLDEIGIPAVDRVLTGDGSDALFLIRDSGYVMRIVPE